MKIHLCVILGTRIMGVIVFKCFFLAVGVLFCSDKPIDVSCLNQKIVYLLANKNTHVEGAINNAVGSCMLNSRGACAWHGGIRYCEKDIERWICHDGFESSVRCQ